MININTMYFLTTNKLKQVMADQLQAGHSRLLAGSTYFGLQVDETTDITTTKELVLLTR